MTVYVNIVEMISVNFNDSCRRRRLYVMEILKKYQSLRGRLDVSDRVLLKTLYALSGHLKYLAPRYRCIQDNSLCGAFCSQ